MTTRPASQGQLFSSTTQALTLRLFDNVQFIYELALAQLELPALGAAFEMDNGLREFRVTSATDPGTLKKRLAYFKSIDGQATDYSHITRKNRTRSVNQYLTHWIYPYKGKFHPQMIRALLNIMGLAPGDTVLDPFIGSGTTAVESQLLGINCLGIDISPLCVMQSRVKAEAIYALAEIEKLKPMASSPLMLPPNTLSEWINTIPSEPVRNFFRMAELLAHSDSTRRRREFTHALAKNVELMYASVKDYRDIARQLELSLGKVDIRQGDARHLSLDDESMDGIITSPPYSIALDYVANDMHAFKALGLDLSKMRDEFIGVRGKGSQRLSLYEADLKKSLAEMFRVLKPGRFCVVVIGNATYQGQEIRTTEFTTEYCQKLGFRLVRNIDKIIFGLYSVMLRENVLIFVKPGVA